MVKNIQNLSVRYISGCIRCLYPAAGGLVNQNNLHIRVIFTGALMNALGPNKHIVIVDLLANEKKIY